MLSLFTPQRCTAAFERSERRSHEIDSTLRRRILSGPDNRRNDEDGDIIRRRNISGPDDGVDGAGEHSGQGFDGTNERGAVLRVDAINDHSSYTENAFGGFMKRAVALSSFMISTSLLRKIEPTP